MGAGRETRKRENVIFFGMGCDSEVELVDKKKRNLFLVAERVPAERNTGYRRKRGVTEWRCSNVVVII